MFVVILTYQFACVLRGLFGVFDKNIT